MDENKHIIATLFNEDAARLADILNTEGIKPILSSIIIEGQRYTTVAVSNADVARSVRTIHLISRNFARKKQKLQVWDKNNILIPVDLTDKSYNACSVGFELAERLNADATVLHSYLAKRREIPYTDVNTIDDDTEIKQKSRYNLDKFCEQLDIRQNNNQLAKVNVTSRLLKGMPEECILEHAKLSRPKLIVMSTRSRHKKAEDLVGSVTAEVLDNCRVPMFTVPENYVCPGIRNITRLVFLCNGESYDKTSMEHFLALFDYPAVHLTLIPVFDGKMEKVSQYVKQLSDYFSNVYPDSKFDTLTINRRSFAIDFKHFIEKENIELLVVLNKRRNIFSRLINPSMAHILLYERDMPMIILPV